jgi:hypothetical protein
MSVKDVAPHLPLQTENIIAEIVEGSFVALVPPKPCLYLILELFSL